MFDALPNELVDLVAQQMDRESFLKFRLTSRKASKISQWSFACRFMKDITIEGSRESVAQTIDMPELPHAQLMAESLTIKSPSLSQSLSESLRHEPGTATIPTVLLAGLLKKMPNVNSLSLRQTWEMSGLMGFDMAHSVLEALLRPETPKLTALDLDEAVLGGGLLLAVLRMHGQSLRKLQLRRVGIESGRTWFEIFGRMRDGLGLQDLVLVDLCDHTLDEELTFVASPFAMVAGYGEGIRDGPDRCWFFGNGAYMSGAGLVAGFKKLAELSEVQP